MAVMRLEYSPEGTVGVPLNIMCSNTWLKPVLPASSSTLPTLYQSCVTTTGARASSRTMTFKPLSSVLLTVSAKTGALIAAHANASVQTLRDMINP